MTTASAPGAEDASWPAPTSAWWAVAVFSAAAVVSFTDRQVLSLLVDPIRNDLHVSDSQVGLVQGLAFVLVYGIAGLPLGRLADIAPRRGLLVAGVLIWSASTVACGVAANYAWLFAARVGVGIGEAALAPAAISMISDLFPAHRRGAAVGTFLMGMTLGSGVAIAVGGLVLQAANGGLFKGLPLIGGLAPWRAALVLLGLPGPVLAAALLTIAEPIRRNLGELARHPSIAETARGFRQRAGVLIPLYLAMALISVGDAAVGGWSPAFMARRFATPPAAIGAWLGAASVATGLLGSVLGGTLADRMVKQGGPSGRMRLAAVAAALGLVGAALGFSSGPMQVVLFFSIWALASTLAQTIGIIAVQEIVPNEMRGVAMALVSLGNILFGIGTGTSLTAFLTDQVYGAPARVGWSISTVAGPAAVLSALLFWLTFRNLKRASS